MNFILLLFSFSTLAATQAQTTIQGTYNFDYKTAASNNLNDPRTKNPLVQQYYENNVKLEGQLHKKPSGIPPYAVLMEPLVQYSQPDPLYDSKKSSINVSVNSNSTKNEFVKRIFFQDQSKGQGNGNTQRPTNGRPQSNGKPQSHRKPQPYGKPFFPHGKHHSHAKPSVIYSNSNKFNSHNVQIVHHGRPPPPPPPPPTYTPVFIEEPEPIIEIIIKESNITLPPPPPLPTPPPPKKKKEQVQVFYVQYQKDPNSYDENKLIYEAPVPAVTPPTNNEDPNEEQEGYDYQSPPPQPAPQYYEEEVTLPPPPSTTLKAFIKPESEIFHGTGGLQISFGGPDQEEDSYSNHHGDYYQQSAPLPSIVLPNKGKNSVISRISTDSQPTKRNPEHIQSQNPLPPFPSTVRPNFNPFVPSQEVQRSTPLPSFQQAPQFPAQTFKSQFLTSSPSFNNQPIHQNQQLAVSSQRSQPAQTYSTLPQNLIQKAQPGHNLFGSSRSPSSQPTVQSPQQYRTINQHQTVQNFQNNAKPLSSQQYHTINHHTAVSPSSVSQSSVTPSNPFVQRNQNNQQRPFNSRPQTSFQEHVQHFQPHQTHQQTPVQNQGQFNRLNQQLSVQNQAQFNQFHPQQQRPIQQLQQHQQQHSFQHQTIRGQHQNQNFKSNNAPEVIKSISPDISYSNQQVELNKSVFSTSKPVFFPTIKSGPQLSTSKPLFHQSSQPIPYSPLRYSSTTESRRFPQTTQPTVEYVTEDPKKLEEEMRKKEEKKKQNIAALPKEVPEDLRQQLLNSGILGNADIQILDYDKIGDIPIESLPPEALANFKQVAGSSPLRRVALPSREEEDSVPAASEYEEVIVPRNSGDPMEMKVVRFNPESKEGAQVANEYVKEGATQLDPVVLNDSKYNRYLPLKVSGAQFPVPDVPQLRGRNVTSVVILAPVDYEFLQRKEIIQDSISRSASPVLEVQGVHFIAGDVLKTLVKTPTAENYRKWLNKENSTSVDKQSVVLLVLEAQNGPDTEAKEIFMFDIGTQKVSKLRGELSSTFVQVAESNSQNEDLEEISDSPSSPGGDFTIRETAGISAALQRTQRKAEFQSHRRKSLFLPLSFKMTRPTLEGSLTKWTNVMKGWQHRWFVLDENAGLLSYYTSPEKMMRGVRRGCVRLKGAILGIDNEEDGNFTITTDSKTFHFQAWNAAQREVWLRALEDTILMHADFPHNHDFEEIVVLRKHMPHHLLKAHFEDDESSYKTNMKKFDNRIAQADALLQILIEQTKAFEERIATVGDKILKARLDRIIKNYNLMLDAVKLAIVFLQILKNTIDPDNGIGLATSHYKSKKSTKSLGSQFYTTKRSVSEEILLQSKISVHSDSSAGEDQPAKLNRKQSSNPKTEVNSPESAGTDDLTDVSNPNAMTLILPPETVPEKSYSSSDEDDFFDADEEVVSVVVGNRNFQTLQVVDSLISIESQGSNVNDANGTQKANEPSTSKRILRNALPAVRARCQDGSLDYDALYEDENETDISMENHGSIITHLLSQVKIGMDLTKVVLPTFILETRSLLEMYADYFAHPDMFVAIVDKKSPKERLVQVVKWYMSAYHAGRKSGVAKKPYNPILGEIFQCHWDVPGLPNNIDSELLVNGPVPWCKRNHLTFISEQVSHHPPVSAFYAECAAKKICFEGFVYTKSKFLGLSVGVHNIGHGTVFLIDAQEEYVVTFPSGYGRSILTTPWIELGGSVTITCKKTGYFANIEFHTKPFYGGKKHRISGELFSPTEKKPFLTIFGEWNGVMEAKSTETGKTEVFINVLITPVTKKNVRKISEQAEYESRNLWKEVTAGLKLNDLDKATNAKSSLEQQQRDDAKKRKDRGISWDPKMFYETSQGDWSFKRPLFRRIDDMISGK